MWIGWGVVGRGLKSAPLPRWKRQRIEKRGARGEGDTQAGELPSGRTGSRRRRKTDRDGEGTPTGQRGGACGRAGGGSGWGAECGGPVGHDVERDLGGEDEGEGQVDALEALRARAPVTDAPRPFPGQQTAPGGDSANGRRSCTSTPGWGMRGPFERRTGARSGGGGG